MANSSNILTAPQQLQLAAWSRDVRATLSRWSQLITLMRNLNAAYNAANGASTLLGLLASGDIVDDSNGLAGSGPETKQNLIDRIANMQTELATYDNSTYLALWAQACGQSNL